MGIRKGTRPLSGKEVIFKKKSKIGSKLGNKFFIS
jgi:hypothetical protein